MAEYGEWNRKGATLSDVTAKKEYGVDQEFIVKGIRAGKLEYREGAIWESISPGLEDGNSSNIYLRNLARNVCRVARTRLSCARSRRKWPS